jgi:hypothetical protein
MKRSSPQLRTIRNGRVGIDRLNYTKVNSEFEDGDLVVVSRAGDKILVEGVGEEKQENWLLVMSVYGGETPFISPPGSGRTYRPKGSTILGDEKEVFAVFAKGGKTVTVCHVGKPGPTETWHENWR